MKEKDRKRVEEVEQEIQHLRQSQEWDLRGFEELAELAAQRVWERRLARGYEVDPRIFPSNLHGYGKYQQEKWVAILKGEREVGYPFS